MPFRGQNINLTSHIHVSDPQYDRQKKKKKLLGKKLDWTAEMPQTPSVGKAITDYRVL